MFEVTVPEVTEVEVLDFEGEPVVDQKGAPYRVSFWKWSREVLASPHLTDGLETYEAIEFTIELKRVIDASEERVGQYAHNSRTLRLEDEQIRRFREALRKMRVDPRVGVAVLPFIRAYRDAPRVDAVRDAATEEPAGDKPRRGKR